MKHQVACPKPHGDTMALLNAPPRDISDQGVETTGAKVAEAAKHRHGRDTLERAPMPLQRAGRLFQQRRVMKRLDFNAT